MADRASIVQASFLGGEYAPTAYGRTGEPQYLTAMARCLNAVPIEEGPWQRRSGFQRIAPTRGRNDAKILAFLASTTCSFIIEATIDNIQFYSGASPIFTNDANTIPAHASFAGGVITATTNTAHGWSVGDCVMLQFPANYAVTSEANCRGRIFRLTTGTTGSTLKMSDDLGNPLVDFVQTFVTDTSLVGATVLRVLKFTTTYAEKDLPNLRLVQAQNAGIILASDVAPNALQVTTPAANADPVFTFGALTVIDGPYLDPQTQSLTLGALTGDVTLTAGSAVFAVTDVGRHLRVFTQPAAYNPAHAYSVGDWTTDIQGGWWTCIVANTGQTPGQPGVSGGVPTIFWVPNVTAGTWAWGKIKSYSSSTSVVWTVDTTISGMALNSANGMTASLWQLGVYSGSTSYPTCGTFFEGRLYLAGAVVNRFDTSVSNGVKNTTVTFSPTDPWDNVVDTNGISLTLNANTLNNFNWLRPAYGGIVVGTFEGEWLISASTLGDPITPTSIQAHLITRYGSANIEPVGTGMALVFPQRYGKRMYEYIDDAFTQKFSGKPLNEKALHLFPSGTVELAYQDEATPVLWARQADGTINGCTYRRISRFITEDPKFNAWHPHRHGEPSAKFTGIACVPAEAGTGDLLYAVVQDALGFWIEVAQPLMPMTGNIRDGFFMDAATATLAGINLKCGNLLPSVGQAVYGTVVDTVWSEPIPPQPLSLPNPGSPPSQTILQGALSGGPGGGPTTPINFVMRQMGVFFNGYSALLNLLPSPKTVNKYTLSCWLYVVGDQGLLFGTSFPVLFTAGMEQSQVIGQGGNRFNYVTDNGSDIIAGHGLAGIGGTGAWVNLLMSADNGAVTSFCYSNDTLIDNTYTTNGLITDTQLGGLAIGGRSSFTKASPEGVPYSFSAAGGQFPDGDGLLAGMSEFWFKTGTALDFSVAGNRGLFHTVDPVTGQYYPTNLGNQGQNVLGSPPDIYLSGGPKQWTVNRARRLKVQTYNIGGQAFFTAAIDPALGTLDPWPPLNLGL